MHALKNDNILYFRQKYFQRGSVGVKNTTTSLCTTMGIAPSHFEEHQQREEEEQSAKALTMMNAHHARSISFGEEIPSDLECTICAEVRAFFVSEITLLGVTCFSRARARAASRAQKRRGKESERDILSGAFACGDSRDDVRPKRRCVECKHFSLSLKRLFSPLFSLGESERLSVDLNACFAPLLFLLSLSTSFSHLRLNQITTTAEI